MKIFKHLFIILLIVSSASWGWGRPRITISYGETGEGFSQVQIKNETSAILACYVAIDGFKTRFQLGSKSRSNWINATDTRFNYQNFSTWCDYLELYPQYKKYKEY